jgi:CRISPR-associated protein Csd1
MILQRLAEQYDRIIASGEEDAIPASGSSLQKISFCIVLEPNGRLNSFQTLQQKVGKLVVAKEMIVPGQSKASGSGINPCFLWDNAAYLLGWVASPDPDPEKAAKEQARTTLSFETFRNKHIEMEAQLAQPAFSAVCSFLRTWSPEKSQEYEALLSEIATGFGVFRIAGEMKFIHEQVSISSEADEDDEEQSSDAGLVQSVCLVSGEIDDIARLHEPKIKGVSGAKSSGALLVSFNAPAYGSYRKLQSYNAPVGSLVAFKYSVALNYLLNRRDRRVSLGDSTVVFWADHASILEDCLSEFFADPLPKDNAVVEEDQERLRQAKILLTQLRDGTGQEVIDTDDGKPTKFFLLGLSPNASRISVRFWVEAGAEELQRRLGQHLRDIALVGNWNDKILTLQRIVRATGRAEHDPNGKLKSFNTENVSPKLAGDLARSVLTGAMYPQSLMATMLRRIHSDGEVAYARAAAIKACLVRNSRLRGNPLEVSIVLDPNSTDPAYCCGRAFALLEVIQKDSAGDGLNRTIKDTYFSSASTTPSLVFPRLCRLSQHHLAKLDTGHRIHREKQFGEVLNKLTVFPRLLSLEDQGKFVLGYFHQTKDIYTSKKDKEEGSDQ